MLRIAPNSTIGLTLTVTLSLPWTLRLKLVEPVSPYAHQMRVEHSQRQRRFDIHRPRERHLIRGPNMSADMEHVG